MKGEYERNGCKNEKRGFGSANLSMMGKRSEREQGREIERKNR